MLSGSEHLLASSNSTLLTAAITLMLFAFFSGTLIGPSFIPRGAQPVFWLNPGFAAFLQIGLGNAVRMPFAARRWRLIQVFMNAEIIPGSFTNIGADLGFETKQETNARELHGRRPKEQQNGKEDEPCDAQKPALGLWRG